MLDIQRYPPILDALLHHAPRSTLIALSQTSRYLHVQVIPVLYADIRLRASQLPALFSGASAACLKYTQRLTVLGKLPLCESLSVDALQAAIVATPLPRLRRVEWLPDHQQPPTQASIRPDARGEASEEPVDGRYIHWQRTYSIISSLPYQDLLIKGSFAILQCTYTSFHLERHTPDRRITFHIDSPGDFASDAPVAQWGGLEAHAATKRPMTIELAPQLLRPTNPRHNTVRFPVHSALLDRLAYMVHMDLIHLTLVGFRQRADHRQMYRAEIELDLISGSRCSRLQLEELGNCLLFKLWNIYTIREDSDRLHLIGPGEERSDDSC